MKMKKPVPGEEKTRKFFAIFPIVINTETRWLEFVTVKYFYSIRGGWIPFAFVDEE